MYGIELVGGKESAQIESIQLKYICEMVTRVGSVHARGYIVLPETYKENILIKAGRKTMKFEKGVRTSTYRLMLKREGNEHRMEKGLQGKRIFKAK